MKHLLVALLLLAAPLHGRIKEGEPWFAGNIIAFFGRNTPPGRFAIETYVYGMRHKGFYDQHSNLMKERNTHQYQLEVELRRGLIEGIDVELQLNGFYIHNNCCDKAVLGDTKLFFGLQVFEDERDSIKPDLRFFVGETFPTGTYKNLDVVYAGADGVGDGAYKTFVALIARKIYYWSHPFCWTLNIFYMHSSEVEVMGSNVYTPMPVCSGLVEPGLQLCTDLAFEFKFNRPWGIGLDIYHEHQNSSPFRDDALPNQTITLPSTDRLSLAPSIEYLISPDLSFVVGAWFTVWGRNATAFTSGVFSFYYQF